MRNKNYLTEDYSGKAHALFEKYHPIEIDPDVSIKEKKEKMEEWWMTHFDLLIKSGLNENDLKNLIEEDEIKLRKGVLEFFDFLYIKKIPLIIMSASRVGDAIKLCLEKEKRLYENIHIVSNLFEWNNDGKVIRVKQPIVHSMNKNETTIENLPIYEELKVRKNVLLLGDGLGDLGMIKGFDYDNFVSIGFLNENVDKNLEKFKEGFDVLLLGDGSFNFVNEFVKEVK